MSRIQSPRLNFIDRLCRTLAPRILRQLGEFERSQVRPDRAQKELDKLHGDLEYKIHSTLEQAYPKDTIGSIAEEGRSWLYHLGGAENLAHGRPDMYLAFALFENGKIVEGAVYAPSNDNLTMVQKSSGAINRTLRLRVSGAENFEGSVVALGLDKVDVQIANIIPSLVEEGALLRLTGAPAMDIDALGSGKADAFVGANMHIVDCTVGALIMSETGGMATDTQGREITNDSTSLVAGNSRMHGKLLKLIAQQKKAKAAS